MLPKKRQPNGKKQKSVIVLMFSKEIVKGFLYLLTTVVFMTQDIPTV